MRVSDNVTRGLTGWFKFLEGAGTNLIDVKSGTVATLAGSPTWVGGKINTYSINFDGVDDEVTVNSSLKVGQIFAYSFWFKRDAENLWYPPFMGSKYFAGVGSSGGAAVYQTQGSNLLRFEILANNTLRQSIIATAGSFGDLTNNKQWNHCVAQSDGRFLSLYLNGRCVGKALKTVTIAWNSAPFVLGGKNTENPGGTAQYYDGQLDDVRIYNRALDESEIRALAMMPYQMPRWFNSVAAGGSLIKTINGLAWASVKSRNGLAVAQIKTINGLTNV